MNVSPNVIDVCRTLRAAGFQAWLVGGAVRDAIMGRDPHDWDIATDARPQQVVELFERVFLTGLQHGTVTVLRDGEPFEVTTFRGDGDYTDGRHPDSVSFVNTIEEDLARRDFTMNAIAFDPIPGEYRDPFGGRHDIAFKVIRCVGNPRERFGEDGLRSLRAARFAAVLEFEIEQDTKGSIELSLETFRKVAAERVCAEWTKALLARRPSIAFRIMAETCLLHETAPEMLAMIGCTQNRYHGFDVWNHTLAVLDATPPDLVVRLAALLHDISKPASKGVHPKTLDATFYDHETMGADAADELLRRLRFSNDVRHRVVHLIRHHLVRYEPGWAASAIRRWVRKVGQENVAPLIALARADIVGKGPALVPLTTAPLDELEARLATMTISAPIVSDVGALAITGGDVMTALGIGPGPRIGQELRRLLEAVTDDPSLNEREALLAMLT